MNLASYVTRSVLGLVASLLAPSLLHADVLTVDTGGGDADFINLQAAVNAAEEGDTLLISGPFGGMAFVTGKSLDLVGVADENGRPRVGAVTVQLLGPGQTVRIRGLDIVGTNTTLLPYPGVLARDCAGSLLVQDCSIDGLRPGVLLERTARTVVSRCTITSGTGFQTPFELIGAGDGVTAIDSSLVVQGCSILGGIGMHARPGFIDPLLDPSDGGHGGVGLRVVRSSVFVVRSSVQGGDGGDGFTGEGLVCLEAGPGGAGLLVADSLSSVRLVDLVPVGGNAGSEAPGCPASGLDGLDIDAPPGTVLFGHRDLRPLAQVVPGGE